jgi:transposase-like protein
MIDDAIMAPHRRRRYSAEFKAQVINACKQPGVSIAATALHYKLNANLVRNWIKAHDQRVSESLQRVPAAEFIALELPSTMRAPTTPDIVIEVKRGAATVTVRWPGAAATDCAAWLQHWLR